MTQHATPSARCKWNYAVILGLAACLVVVACTVWQRSAPVTETARSDRPVERQRGPKKGESARHVPSATPPKAPDQPFTEESIAALQARIKAESDYADRLELRRVLIHGLRTHDMLDRTLLELGALFTDVENQEGLDMAQRVALAEANTLELQKDFKAAARAYELLAHRYRGGRFTAEALLHQGNCQLELRDYAAAELTWQMLINEQPQSGEAPWGWRKIALAQLLQGKFDSSLATLKDMETKFTGTEFGEYAQMRRGYVLMQAGKLPEARQAYEEFQKHCPNSKYCRLVQQQLLELETAGKVAKAGSASPLGPRSK